MVLSPDEECSAPCTSTKRCSLIQPMAKAKKNSKIGRVGGWLKEYLIGGILFLWMETCELAQGGWRGTCWVARWGKNFGQGFGRAFVNPIRYAWDWIRIGRWLQRHWKALAATVLALIGIVSLYGLWRRRKNRTRTLWRKEGLEDGKAGK